MTATFVALIFTAGFPGPITGLSAATLGQGALAQASPEAHAVGCGRGRGPDALGGHGNHEDIHAPLVFMVQMREHSDRTGILEHKTRLLLSLQKTMAPTSRVSEIPHEGGMRVRALEERGAIIENMLGPEGHSKKSHNESTPILGTKQINSKENQNGKTRK